MIIGDSNIFNSLVDKWGWRNINQSLARAYNSFLFDQHLRELTFKGPRFTWLNHQMRSDRIMERIDKVVVNFEWRSMFLNYSLIHGKIVASDHHPLILFLHSQACSSNCPFIFDLKWTRYPDYDTIIEEIRRNENCNGDIVAKMENCKTTLVHWSKLSFGNAKKCI